MVARRRLMDTMRRRQMIGNNSHSSLPCDTQRTKWIVARHQRVVLGNLTVTPGPENRMQLNSSAIGYTFSIATYYRTDSTVSNTVC